MRFPRECRLHTSKEFDAVRQKGNFLPGKYFHLQVYFTETPHRSVRLGIAVSRRVGNAVVRNKLKRRIREIFRSFQEKCRVSCDIVLIARKEASEASFYDLKREFGKRTANLCSIDDTTNG